MEKSLKFSSQVCTTIEQSKKLLELGLKPETADMAYQAIGATPFKKWEEHEIEEDFIPAWSLHRLIELYKTVEDKSMWSLENVNYNRLIQCIRLAIKHNDFSKEYLKNYERNKHYNK